jgi:hypothetical protein
MYNVKLSLCLINWAPHHEDIWGTEGTAPLILNLGTRWKRGVSSTPRPLYPRGKSPRVPIGQEAGWTPERVWTPWKREKSLASAGNRTPIPQPSSLAFVGISTELFRLLCVVIGSWKICNFWKDHCSEECKSTSLSCEIYIWLWVWLGLLKNHGARHVKTFVKRIIKMQLLELSRVFTA